MLLVNNIGCLASMDEEIGEINNAALLIEDDTIFWCGEATKIPRCIITQTIDAAHSLVMPGLIDCHTHLIFSGSRAQEFARRMNGESYAAIMAQGGGINASVRDTRNTLDEELFNVALARTKKIMSQGVTTLEVKSGYGLSFDQELRILRIIKKLAQAQPLELHPTFLGAHVVPIEFKQKPKDYVDLIAGPLLEQVAKERLALDCDVFCEEGAFSVANARKILSSAHSLGLGLRAHVQQLGPGGGISLLEHLPIKSISHADYLSSEDIALIAHATCVVEVLPFANLFLRQPQLPPVHKLRAAGVNLAVATDFNPGSAMCDDLILAARLALTLHGFDIISALKSITCTAARSLGRDDIGMIKAGHKADILITNFLNIDDFFYDWTKNPVRKVIKNGKAIALTHSF